MIFVEKSRTKTFREVWENLMQYSLSLHYKRQHEKSVERSRPTTRLLIEKYKILSW